MYLGDARLELGGSTEVKSNQKFSLIVAETIELNGSLEVHIKVYESSVVPVPPNILGTETLMAHLTKSPGINLSD
jgi:hypothetical protein